VRLTESEGDRRRTGRACLHSMTRMVGTASDLLRGSSCWRRVGRSCGSCSCRTACGISVIGCETLMYDTVQEVSSATGQVCVAPGPSPRHLEGRLCLRGEMSCFREGTFTSGSAVPHFPATSMTVEPAAVTRCSCWTHALPSPPFRAPSGAARGVGAHAAVGLHGRGLRGSRDPDDGTGGSPPRDDAIGSFPGRLRGRLPRRCSGACPSSPGSRFPTWPQGELGEW
jgi:hypothetical protein